MQNLLLYSPLLCKTHISSYIFFKYLKGERQYWVVTSFLILQQKVFLNWRNVVLNILSTQYSLSR